MVALAVSYTPTTTDLVARRAELEQRLTLGWRRIDAAVAAGRDVRAWEEHWVALLGEYERVCDAIRAAPASRGEPY